MPHQTITTPPSPPLPTLLRRLPPELRLEIFRLAFHPETAREVITITRVPATSPSTTTTLDLQYKDQHKPKQAVQFARRKLWLQPSIVGPDLALEAAEALYRSKAMFAVHADDAVSFLSSCPLSGLSNPGRLISRLHLYADEDPAFTPDTHGHSLRLADWIDLSRKHPTKPTRSTTTYTSLTRVAWRSILLMPSLCNFELRILPRTGKLPLSQHSNLEIRDHLPSLFRLFARGVGVQVYMRTWNAIGVANPLPALRCRDPLHPNAYEEPVDLDAFLPFGGGSVRVPEVGLGSSLGKDGVVGLPLECLWSVKHPGARAVRGAVQARCRAVLYFTLEALLVRVLGSRDHDLLHLALPTSHHQRKEISTSCSSIPIPPSALLCFEAVAEKLYKQACKEQKEELLVRWRGRDRAIMELGVWGMAGAMGAPGVRVGNKVK